MTADIAAAFIEHIGDFADETVILMDGFGVGFAEQLKRLGAARVMKLRANGQPEPQSASLALVPHIPSIESAQRAVERLRDAIVTNGRLVCCADTKCGLELALAIGKMWKAHGFAAINAAHAGGHLLLSAEVPMFGPWCHA
jgi:hypothetical protein